MTITFEDKFCARDAAASLEITEGVLTREIRDINARREAVARNAAAWIAAHPEFAPPQLDTTQVLVREGREPLNVLGLALSGGGIRSAAFCLGVLQALDVSLRKRTDDNTAPSPLLRVDYLSTVSGGGYIGTSMAAAMSVTGGKFPFESKLDSEETPSMQHVRNYSNYLFPTGPGDFLRNASIYLRGLVANLMLVVPWLLLFAAATTVLNPAPEWLDRPVLLADWRSQFGPAHFFFTLWLGVAGFGGLLMWGLLRSLPGLRTQPELPSGIVRCVGYLLIGLLIVAFIELQPLAIGELIEDAGKRGAERPALAVLIDRLVMFLTPIAVAVSFLWEKLQAFVERAKTSPRIQRKLLAAATLVAIYLGAAALPIVLWAAYLKLAFWAISGAVAGASVPGWLDFLAQCEWLTGLAGFFSGVFGWLASVNPVRAVKSFEFASVYFFVWLFFFAIAWLLDPNANSLHRLYRDRLSKAFLFEVKKDLREPDEQIERMATLREGSEGKADAANTAKLPVPPPAPPPAQRLDRMLIDGARRMLRALRTRITPTSGLKLSALSRTDCPYLLINTALNLQSSKVANRRGRNADFFIFSRNAIGSDATGYIDTGTFEDLAVPDLTLDTAMAISGAAFNANMGSLTIRPLSPTLAFLNVRLGFWMRNPKHALEKSRLCKLAKRLANPYILYEMLGRLDEQKWDVYVSDGGHLENLGVFELLKRRCKVIIAVDVEADEKIRMASFITLQRYARIDLGVRIELPWQRIATASEEAAKAYREESGTGGRLNCRGPHCAVGVIHYKDGSDGVLVYVKSSLTGDENDYVADYRRRYEQFPHETTLDQFFSEEQFEVYRALGFHALDRMLDGTDEVAVHSARSAEGELKKFSAPDPLFGTVKRALGFQV